MRHVIVMGENINAWRILVRKLEEIDYRDKISVDARIILKWILKKKMGP
jgi:hypothetical protein